MSHSASDKGLHSSRACTEKSRKSFYDLASFPHFNYTFRKPAITILRNLRHGMNPNELRVYNPRNHQSRPSAVMKCWYDVYSTYWNLLTISSLKDWIEKMADSANNSGVPNGMRLVVRFWGAVSGLCEFSLILWSTSFVT